MRLRVEQVDIRLAIQEHDLIMNIIPAQRPGIVAWPHCEIFDPGQLPLDVMAWLNILDKLAS